MNDGCEHFANFLVQKINHFGEYKLNPCVRFLRGIQICGAFKMHCMLLSLSRSVSLMLMRVDGVDQAKFRVPRTNVKTHLTDKLIRPALHVQGCWAHGFGFHFAVSDADNRKDITTNVEAAARMLESIYKRHGALTYTLVLIQDNACR